jgi:hypothetical protein
MRAVSSPQMYAPAPAKASSKRDDTSIPRNGQGYSTEAAEWRERVKYTSVHINVEIVAAPASVLAQVPLLVCFIHGFVQNHGL